MSTSLATMIRLRAVQNKILSLFENMDDNTYRLQFHPDLSAAGWYLGHCMFVENYWLHEVIQNNNQYTKNLHTLFGAQRCPASERGPRLPKLASLLDEMHAQQDANDLMLLEMIPPLSDHKLFQDEYIENYLIQHYARHCEDIQIIFNQIAIKRDKGNYQPEKILAAAPTLRNVEEIPAGQYLVGGDSPICYDNELPQHQENLDSFYIAQHPVSNAEFLYFMEQGGYSLQEYWSEEGWQWLQTSNARQPEHWQQNQDNQWYGITAQGPGDLLPENPVYGINYFEAEAFANWANARLPHESEWETAVRQNQLANSGQVWEWCGNRFLPYEGFHAFPGETGSTQWLDGHHYSLRGASYHSRPEIRRASFRNFSRPDRRYLFAGLRLVFD